MFEEALGHSGQWEQVMPGARACLFSLGEGPVSLPLRLEPLHFEALFCLAGAITLIRRDGSALTAGPGQVLLLTDLSGVTGASVDGPLSGVLVAVDARNAKESLDTICRLLGGLTLDTNRVRQWMASRGGCAVEGPTPWSRAAFAQLERLPQKERARWCVWKSVELLYLLCAPQEPAPAQAGNLEEVARYMEEHLDEPLSIPQLSRRALLSPTAFKAAFRQRYGLAVHAWLRQRRMERAAQLLRGSSLTVLEVAQSVGYSSGSQFTAAFRERYGTSPGKFRKMSKGA
ncbi:MAG TPA: AraC family transcriptional regulator [Candidatus Acutalibacter stercorigallinarum]|nr:AraC family transcriptional regulator [Candidatus Acutalibacter stercorigallinarum]